MHVDKVKLSRRRGETCELSIERAELHDDVRPVMRELC